MSEPENGDNYMTGPAGEGGGAANQGQGGGGIPATLFTQDQVNHFNAQAKREALGGFFKELGFDNVPDTNTLKDTLGKATEFDKLQEGQKNDVQRLTDQLGEANRKAEQLPELETVIQRQKIAATMQLPVEVWEFVKGKTDDEIKASVEGIKKVMRLDTDGGGGEGQQQQQGSGSRPPEPNPQQGRGGGQPPGKTMASGAEAYKQKYKKE